MRKCGVYIYESQYKNYAMAYVKKEKKHFLRDCDYDLANLGLTLGNNNYGSLGYSKTISYMEFSTKQDYAKFKKFCEDHKIFEVDEFNDRELAQAYAMGEKITKLP